MMAEDSYMIPVTFHTLKGYDSHLVMLYITRKYAPNSIDVIPTCSEKFLSFQIGNLCDSLQFLTASLDTLVQRLAADSRDNLLIPRGITRTLIWFSQRGITLTDTWMKETFLLTELPPINAFNSSLSEETITPEEYDRAQKV